MCRTLVLVDFFLGMSGNLALSAVSQSKTEWTERALKGEHMGESRLDTAGLGGSFKLGKVAGPVGGADIGCAELVNGLGGTMGAVAGGVVALTLVVLVSFSEGAEVTEVTEETLSLHEPSDRSLFAVAGGEASEESGEIIGELRDMALVRKSV